MALPSLTALRTLGEIGASYQRNWTASSLRLKWTCRISNSRSSPTPWEWSRSMCTIVARQSIRADRGRSIDLLLEAGTYRITIRTLDPTRVFHYRLGAAAFSDPTGARAADPTTSPEQSGSTPPAPPDGNSSNSSDIQWDPNRDVENAEWY